MEERVDPRLFNLRTDGFPTLVRGSVLKAQYAVVHAATPTSVRLAYDPEFDTDDLDDRRSYRVLGITTLGHPVVEEETRWKSAS